MEVYYFNKPAKTEGVLHNGQSSEGAEKPA